jgi:hypothetical protein
VSATAKSRSGKFLSLMNRMLSDDARTRIQKALEAGGAQFIAENGGGPGVRCERRSKAENANRTVLADH